MASSEVPSGGVMIFSICFEKAVVCKTSKAFLPPSINTFRSSSCERKLGCIMGASFESLLFKLTEPLLFGRKRVGKILTPSTVGNVLMS